MRARGRWLDAAFAAAWLLLPAEAVVRACDLDLRYLAPLVYYQGADLPAHEVVDDERFYALRPGFSGVLRGCRIGVNSLGFRGPERPARKAPGTLRVLCYGSSNTYGAEVGDEDTWPSLLQGELARRLRRPVEVWNGGVSAYDVRQMLAAARRGISLYEPDLVLLQVWNFGELPLLMDAPIDPAFERDPALLCEYLSWVPFGARGARALGHWRAARFVVVAINYALPRPTPHSPTAESARAELAAAAAFSRDARVPWLVVLPPGTRHSEVAAPAERQLLLADQVPPGAGPEYWKIHPPARVYRWYAKTIARLMLERGLIPGGAR